MDRKVFTVMIGFFLVFSMLSIVSSTVIDGVTLPKDVWGVVSIEGVIVSSGEVLACINGGNCGQTRTLGVYNYIHTATISQYTKNYYLMHTLCLDGEVLSFKIRTPDGVERDVVMSGIIDTIHTKKSVSGISEVSCSELGDDNNLDLHIGERPGCPECPGPSGWSECIYTEQTRTTYNYGEQTRTDYKCDVSTDYKCELFTEKKGCSKTGFVYNYQENANKFECEGDWWPKYGPCSNTYDGKWNTNGVVSYLAGTATVYFDYVKPDNVLRHSLWQVKDPGGTFNLTIPTKCWNQDPLQFKAESTDVVRGADYVRWSCLNTLGGWEELRSSGVPIVYEESMWWNTEIELPPEPTPPEPSGFIKFIQSIINWLKDLFSKIFPFAITGPQVVEPNTQHTYQIDLSAPIPDSDWSDGSYQVQYANWALIDSSGNIKQQGQWERINGRYTKSVTITTPTNIGDYVLLGMITQYNMNYDFNTGQWITGEETIINKEAIDLRTEYVIEEPEVPIPSGFQKFINDIINFLKNLWASIFG